MQFSGAKVHFCKRCSLRSQTFLSLFQACWDTLQQCKLHLLSGIWKNLTQQKAWMPTQICSGAEVCILYFFFVIVDRCRFEVGGILHWHTRYSSSRTCHLTEIQILLTVFSLILHSTECENDLFSYTIELRTTLQWSSISPTSFIDRQNWVQE